MSRKHVKQNETGEASAPLAEPSGAEDQDVPVTSGLLRRMAALLYDAFLVAAIWMTMGFALQFIVGADTSQLVDGRVQTDPVLDVILFTGEVLGAATFYIWFWMRTGQTLGMIAWRIKAVNVDGNLMSLKQGVLRFLLAWPAFFCFGIGYLWLYIDRNGDALHDKFSGTRVIVLPKSASPF
ncbi:MAG: RDD family protein [Pseudomonadota bacterium]